MIAIRAEGLHTYYGKSHILHGVSLEVRQGEIVTLLGRNGAGKTTTLRSLIGLTPPREGKVTLFDADVTGLPPYRIAASGVGYVPEGRRVFANLTVDENLKVPVERPGPWTPARIYEVFPRLAERKSNKGSQLSGGEQEMLSISRALLLNPKLLMLDEPTAGMGDQETFEIARLIRNLHRREGLTIMLIEHDMRMVFNLADRIMVLAEGKVLAEGAPDEIAGSEAVQAAYLGKAAA